MEKNGETDNDLYRSVSAYRNNLKAARDNFEQTGLNDATFSNLLNARRAYTSVMTPANEAIEYGKELTKRYNDAQNKTGGRAIFSYNPNTTNMTLYAFQNKDNPGYYINADDITKDSAAMWSNMKGVLTKFTTEVDVAGKYDISELKQMYKEQLDKGEITENDLKNMSQTILRIKQNGIDPGSLVHLLNFMKHSGAAKGGGEAFHSLEAMAMQGLQDIMNSYGNEGKFIYSTPVGQSAAMAAYNKGIWNALGTTTITPEANPRTAARTSKNGTIEKEDNIFVPELTKKAYYIPNTRYQHIEENGTGYNDAHSIGSAMSGKMSYKRYFNGAPFNAKAKYSWVNTNQLSGNQDFSEFTGNLASGDAKWSVANRHTIGNVLRPNGQVSQYVTYDDKFVRSVNDKVSDAKRIKGKTDEESIKMAIDDINRKSDIRVYNEYKPMFADDLTKEEYERLKSSNPAKLKEMINKARVKADDDNNGK